MIRGGLVSITFRKLNPREIVDLMTRTNLVGIEWGGDVHVPHGEIDVAREVAQMTRDAGLLVAAYGSYYRVGVSEADGLAFERVLESAMALGAPTVRVWAGNRGSADADQAIAPRSSRMRAGSPSSPTQPASPFPSSITEIRLPIRMPRRTGCWRKWAIRTCAPTGSRPSPCRRQHASRVWMPSRTISATRMCFSGSRHRPRPPRTGDRWPKAARCGGNTWSGSPPPIAITSPMIEFVRDDAPEQFLADARVLSGWLAELNGR